MKYPVFRLPIPDLCSSRGGIKEGVLGRINTLRDMSRRAALLPFVNDFSRYDIQLIACLTWFGRVRLLCHQNSGLPIDRQTPSEFEVMNWNEVIDFNKGVGRSSFQSCPQR
jgi:hypothetical protein